MISLCFRARVLTVSFGVDTNKGLLPVITNIMYGSIFYELQKCKQTLFYDAVNYNAKTIQNDSIQYNNEQNKSKEMRTYMELG